MESLSDTEDSSDEYDYPVSKTTSNSKTTQTDGGNCVYTDPNKCYLDSASNKSIFYNDVHDVWKYLPPVAVCNNQAPVPVCNNQYNFDALSLCHLHSAGQIYPFSLPWFPFQFFNPFMPFSFAPTPFMQCPQFPMVLPAACAPNVPTAPHQSINVKGNCQLIDSSRVPNNIKFVKKKRGHTLDLSQNKVVKNKFIEHRPNKMSKTNKRIKKLEEEYLSKCKKLDDIKNSFVSDTSICTNNKISNQLTTCCHSTVDINYDSSSFTSTYAGDKDKNSKSSLSTKESSSKKLKTSMTKSASLPLSFKEEVSRDDKSNTGNKKVVKRYINRCLTDQGKNCNKNLNCNLSISSKLNDSKYRKKKLKTDNKVDNKLANILCDFNDNNEINYNNSKFYNNVIKKTIDIALKEGDKDNERITPRKENEKEIPRKNLIDNSKKHSSLKNSTNLLNYDINNMMSYEPRSNFNRNFDVMQTRKSVTGCKEMFSYKIDENPSPEFKNSHLDNNISGGSIIKNESNKNNNYNSSKSTALNKSTYKNVYSKTNMSDKYSNQSSLSQSSSCSSLMSSSSSSLPPFPVPSQSNDESQFYKNNKNNQLNNNGQFDNYVSKNDGYDLTKSLSSKSVSYSQDIYYNQPSKVNLMSNSQSNNSIDNDASSIPSESNKKYNSMTNLLINNESCNDNIYNEENENNKSNFIKNLTSPTSEIKKELFKANETMNGKDHIEKDYSDVKKNKKFENIVAHFILPTKNNAAVTSNNTKKNNLNNIENVNDDGLVGPLINNDQNNINNNKNYTKISFSVNYDPNDPENVIVGCAQDGLNVSESAVDHDVDENIINDNVLQEESALTDYETDDISKIIDDAMKNNNFFDNNSYEINNNSWEMDVPDSVIQPSNISAKRRTRFSQYSVLNNVETLSIISEEDEDLNNNSNNNNNTSVRNMSNIPNVDSYLYNQNNCKGDIKRSNNDLSFDGDNVAKNCLRGMYFNDPGLYNSAV